MILLDCGNSQLKAQAWRDDRLVASCAIAYRRPWLERVSTWLDAQDTDRCYFASVLGVEHRVALDACLAARFGNAVTRFRSEAAALGVRSAYAEPATLGVDRWLALLGAAGLCGGDCFIVDAGSAITLDLLRADGTHLGGAILPGVNTSRADFERIFHYLDFTDPAIGRADEPANSTAAAIHVDYARDSLEELCILVQRWQIHLAKNAPILLAGGDAPRVLCALDHPIRLVPDLVFRGMRRLAAA